MDIHRREINVIRQELNAVKPDHFIEPLPPQPSIVPGPKEPFFVRGGRRIDNLSHRYPKARLLFRKSYNILRGRSQGVDSKGIKHQIKQFALPIPKKVQVSIVIPVFNKCDLTIRCLRSIHDMVPASIGYEVIIIDNHSTDATTYLSKLKGLRYIRSDENLGFVGGCNFGASLATGKYLVFLNNDTTVTKGWLEELINTIESYPKAGIVGSKLIYPDGRLQEAGGVIFKDGTGNNYGKNDHPDRYQYNYVREVDYCSGASIIIARSVFEQLKGFDTLYHPAYYEDTDLAFRVRQLGYKVVYQPKSVVYHFEGATAGTDTSSGFKKYQEINHEKFMKRWGKLLKTQQFTPDKLYIARDRSNRKLFLIVDEHVPTPDQDSGSVRIVALIKLLQEMGYKVTLFPNYTKHREKYTESLEQIGVEVIYGEVRFEDFIHTYGKYYDGVILSRPRIGSYYMDLCQAYCTKAKIIYDTVDLHYLRLGRQAEYEKGKLKVYYEEMAEKHEKLEHYLIKEADIALVVSETEQSLLKEKGLNNVRILSNIHTIHNDAYGVSFQERKDLVFVGGYRHLPNIDAVNWFVDKILPVINQHDDSIKLHVVGSEMPDTLKEHLKKQKNVIVDGFAEDLSDLLTYSRVFIAPMRFGAGVKGKIGQAIEYGLPVVTTSIGAEGMFLKNNDSCLTADDPDIFANSVLRLYKDEELWLQLQKAAKVVVENHFSVKKARHDLQQILK